MHPNVEVRREFNVFFSSKIHFPPFCYVREIIYELSKEKAVLMLHPNSSPLRPSMNATEVYKEETEEVARMRGCDKFVVSSADCIVLCISMFC